MFKIILMSAAVAAAASSAPTAQLPPGVYPGKPVAQLAPAGSYALDPAHTAVIAKVSHLGYSLSVFRFDKVEGLLHWDPSGAADSIQATVATASISTPVPGFAAQLAGTQYLNAARFPTAQFVSTRFRQIDATHAEVDGRFTLLGKTVPLAFHVELIGAGKGFLGHSRIGAEAMAQIAPADFGLSPLLGSSITLIIDAEFARTA